MKLPLVDPRNSVCWICRQEYRSDIDMKECKSKGLVVPRFKIGDTVMYKEYFGSDRDGSYYGKKKKTGVVRDILFPMPLFNYHLLHTYEVSYLIRVITPGCERDTSSPFFFDKGNIKRLLEAETLEVADESSTLFKDGTHVNADDRSRRTFVIRWNDYVVRVVRLNPQLKGRLAGFTAKLRELDCLD